jgi:predicted enzyme related to lactoylglutathione lyase
MSEDTSNSYALNTGKAFLWHELYTPDVDAALAFYKSALDMDASSMEMGEYGKYHMLKHAGNEVAGVIALTGPEFKGVPPHWATYTSVDDVDARVAKVIEFGGKVLVPAMDVPTVGRMALIADPHGASIWLFKPNPAQA